MRLLYLCWLNIPLVRPLADRLMTRAFDAMAPQWDSYNTDPGRLDPLFTAVERVAETATPTRVLDLGCGNGTVAIWLARRFGEAWAFGIDVSPVMIEQATQRASESGSAARFSVGCNEHSGFADGEFDLITLVNVPPPFEEIARLLTPGGHVVVVFTKGPKTWFYSNPDRLARGLGKHGVAVIDQATRGRGEYLIAAKQ